MVRDETEKFLLLARKSSCLMQSISITYIIFKKYDFINSNIFNFNNYQVISINPELGEFKIFKLVAIMQICNFTNTEVNSFHFVISIFNLSIR